MSAYVLDVPRFDKSNPPTNTRRQRVFVFGVAGGWENARAVAEKVFDMDGNLERLSEWPVSDRIALYEEMRKAEREFATPDAGMVQVTGRFS